jgi:hypothetical protein
MANNDVVEFELEDVSKNYMYQQEFILKLKKLVSEM